MSYDADNITMALAEPFDGGLRVTYQTTQTDYLQLYCSGVLLDWQEITGGSVAFLVQDIRDTDILFPLGVDEANAETNYWSEAFPEANAHGNKIQFKVPQLMANGIGDVLMLYRGDAGDGSAGTKIYEGPLFPGNRRKGGYGFNYGYGGYGWDGDDAIGYGHNYGYGEYGFDCEMFTWETEPLPPGTYPVKVVIKDAAGNESTAYTTTVVVDTYARPASDLAVSSYVEATDTLTLAWTASPDIS